MKRLLVTGGAGFIGANFVHYWLANHPGDRVVVLDALTYAGNIETLTPLMGNPNFRFVKGNICNNELVELLLREEGIDTLVHFAAESHVDRSITGPDAFIETNIIGTHSLLKAARAVWLASTKAMDAMAVLSTDGAAVFAHGALVAVDLQRIDDGRRVVLLRHRRRLSSQSRRHLRG